jgi:hypothetical protein
VTCDAYISAGIGALRCWRFGLGACCRCRRFGLRTGRRRGRFRLGAGSLCSDRRTHRTPASRANGDGHSENTDPYQAKRPVHGGAAEAGSRASRLEKFVGPHRPLLIQDMARQKRDRSHSTRRARWDKSRTESEAAKSHTFCRRRSASAREAATTIRGHRSRSEILERLSSGCSILQRRRRGGRLVAVPMTPGRIRRSVPGWE